MSHRILRLRGDGPTGGRSLSLRLRDPPLARRWTEILKTPFVPEIGSSACAEMDQ